MTTTTQVQVEAVEEPAHLPVRGRRHGPRRLRQHAEHHRELPEGRGPR